MLLPRLALVLVLGAVGCAGPTVAIAGAPSPAETITVVPTMVQPVVPKYSEDPRIGIAAALETAKATDRRVLIDFGADWCPECRLLDELYQDASVSPLLTSKFVLIKIDVGDFDKHMDVAHDYDDVTDDGIPALVVLDADGTTLGTTRDWPATDADTLVAGDVLAFLQQWV